MIIEEFNIKHGVQINFEKTSDIPKKQLICYKNLPNGKLIIGKLYDVEHIYNGKTDFSTYIYYTIDGSYFSSEKYDPYFVGNYFTTKAQLRDMRIDEILND